MGDLKLLPGPEPPNKIGDWAIRGGVTLLFFLAGLEKFSDSPGSHWVKLFQEIGAGTWFRYFTGVVEILGALLLLIPRTTLWGIAGWACTMASAAAILWLRLGRPGEGAFPGIILIGLIAFGWNRWKSTAATPSTRESGPLTASNEQK